MSFPPWGAAPPTPPAYAFTLAEDAEKAVRQHERCSEDQDQLVGLIFVHERDERSIVWPTRRPFCMIREMVFRRGARWVGIAERDEWDQRCPRDLSEMAT